MKFTYRKLHINKNRHVCQLKEDGEVVFAQDVTIEELKWAIGALLRKADRAYQNQDEITLKEIDKKYAQEAALDEMVRLGQEMGYYVDTTLLNDDPPKKKPFKCPECRCHAGCCCCKEGYCGCKEDQIIINEDQ